MICHMMNLLAVLEWDQWTLIIPIALAVVILIVGEVYWHLKNRRKP